MTSMGPYTTKESCGVECTPKASKVGVTIWVAKKETAKEVKKIFVANLSANGMYRKKVTFIGGKKILIEGKAGAVIGKNNFYYRVSSYPFRQDGSVLSGEVKKENSNINNHNVITMNYGAGSTIDSKTFFAPESPPPLHTR